MKFLFKLLSISLLFIFISCDVNFDEDYRAYIDDIAERNPLNFTITGSSVIDGEDAINMGYLIADKTVTYTIYNSEKVDIHLKDFGGIDGDFTVAPFTAFTLEPGDNFSLDITFNVTTDNWEKTVSSEVAFYDSDDRPFRFNIWATSDKKPLKIYDLEDNIITELDLQAWETDKDFQFKVVNKGLVPINVTNTNVPGGVDYKSPFGYTLEVHESSEITLCYDYYSYIVLNGVNLEIVTDFRGGTNYLLKLYGGGGLPITVRDSNKKNIGNSYSFTTTVSTPVSETFTIQNNSDKALNLELRLDTTNSSIADLYNYTPISLDLNSLGSKTFDVSFNPDATGTYNINFYIRNIDTNRSHTITFNGTGS